MFDQKKISSSSTVSFIILVTIATFLAWFLLSGYNLIYQPFVWDDLHLIKVYSIEEIYNSWFSNWIPNKIETPSYRPVAILYYNFLGLIFGENTFYLRFFIFLMMIALIILVNFFLYQIGFNKLELLFFTLLITFSKIYSTLLSWITLSALIFTYINALLSIIFFISWLKNKKIQNYIFCFLFAILSIFTREELYVLPIFIFLSSLLITFEMENKVKRIFFGTLPLVLLVIFHMYLRKEFVPEAPGFEITLDYIKYGNEIIGFGGLIKAFKASWFPMGFFSIRNFNLGQYYFQIIWLILLILICITNYVFNKKAPLNFNKILIFIFLIILLCAPHIAILRSFGIFLPSIFVLAIITIFLKNLFKLMLNEIHLYKKIIFSLLIFCTMFVAILGGYLRSKDHINSMNLYSVHIVNFDSKFIYEYTSYPNFNAPVERINKKRLHLENLNITKKIYKKINNLNDYKSISKKIIFTKYDPLSF